MMNTSFHSCFLLAKSTKFMTKNRKRLAETLTHYTARYIMKKETEPAEILVSRKSPERGFLPEGHTYGQQGNHS